MNSYDIPQDVTEEFFNLNSMDFSDFCSDIGSTALSLSFALPAEQGDQLLLRRIKAWLETGRDQERTAAIIANEEQVWIEPNVFSSGVIRLDPSGFLEE